MNISSRTDVSVQVNHLKMALMVMGDWPNDTFATWSQSRDLEERGQRPHVLPAPRSTRARRLDAGSLEYRRRALKVTTHDIYVSDSHEPLAQQGLVRYRRR